VPAGDLIFMGPPGSGKGTQAKLLMENSGAVQLSTGDLFRANIAQGTELGKLAQSYVSKGQYVPDEVTVRMVRARLLEIPPSTRIVFDGFPRTVAQAQQLDDLLKERGRRISAVLLLDVSRDELLSRLSKRAKVEGRADDTPEVIAQRLDVYEQQTRPVIDHYEKQGLLRRVPGVGSVEEVAKRLSGAANVAAPA